MRHARGRNFIASDVSGPSVWIFILCSDVRVKRDAIPRKFGLFLTYGTAGMNILNANYKKVSIFNKHKGKLQVLLCITVP
jgi:hypothetical protein